jgi:hypothetical protein
MLRSICAPWPGAADVNANATRTFPLPRPETPHHPLPVSPCNCFTAGADTGPSGHLLLTITLHTGRGQGEVRIGNTIAVIQLGFTTATPGQATVFAAVTRQRHKRLATGRTIPLSPQVSNFSPSSEDPPRQGKGYDRNQEGKNQVDQNSDPRHPRQRNQPAREKNSIRRRPHRQHERTAGRHHRR